LKFGISKAIDDLGISLSGSHFNKPLLAQTMAHGTWHINITDTFRGEIYMKVTLIYEGHPDSQQVRD
jgi:hypothetical protein